MKYLFVVLLLGAIAIEKGWLKNSEGENVKYEIYSSSQTARGYSSNSGVLK